MSPWGERSNNKATIMTAERNVSRVSHPWRGHTHTHTMLAPGLNRQHQRLSWVLAPALKWNPESPGSLSFTTVNAEIWLVNWSKLKLKVAVCCLFGKTNPWVEMLIKLYFKAWKTEGEKKETVTVDKLTNFCSVIFHSLAALESGTFDLLFLKSVPL